MGEAEGCAATISGMCLAERLISSSQIHMLPLESAMDPFASDASAAGVEGDANSPSLTFFAIIKSTQETAPSHIVSLPTMTVTARRHKINYVGWT